MLSLRLPDEHLARIDSLSRAQGLTRSQWLRLLVEKEIAANDAKPDAHQLYLEIMARAETAGGVMSSDKPDLGAKHSKYVKEKLRAKHRR